MKYPSRAGPPLQHAAADLKGMGLLQSSATATIVCILSTLLYSRRLKQFNARGIMLPDTSVVSRVTLPVPQHMRWMLPQSLIDIA